MIRITCMKFMLCVYMKLLLISTNFCFLYFHLFCFVFALYSPLKYCEHMLATTGLSPYLFVTEMLSLRYVSRSETQNKIM